MLTLAPKTQENASITTTPANERYEQQSLASAVWVFVFWTCRGGGKRWKKKWTSNVYVIVMISFQPTQQHHTHSSITILVCIKEHQTPKSNKLLRQRSHPILKTVFLSSSAGISFLWYRNRERFFTGSYALFASKVVSTETWTWDRFDLLCIYPSWYSRRLRPRGEKNTDTVDWLDSMVVWWAVNPVDCINTLTPIYSCKVPDFLFP